MSPGFTLSIGLCGCNMGLYFTAEHFKANPIRWGYVTAGDITLSSPAWDGQGAQEVGGGESSGAWEATARPGPAAVCTAAAATGVRAIISQQQHRGGGGAFLERRRKKKKTGRRMMVEFLDL